VYKKHHAFYKHHGAMDGPFDYSQLLINVGVEGIYMCLVKLKFHEFICHRNVKTTTPDKLHKDGRYTYKTIYHILFI